VNGKSAIDFNQVPRWIDELSFRPGPPWLSMGTRALRDGPLLVQDELHSDYLAQKRTLFDSAREVVSLSLPEATEAAAEAAELVSSRLSGPNPIGNFHPLERAALQVQEDLVVLIRSEKAWRFGAGVVCFPSHWVPNEKLGLPMTEVHEPVPHYDEELAQRVDRFLDQLAPGRNAWRRNWMIHASPQLHVPHPAVVDGAVRPQDLWLRSERQVLWALPTTGGILFTIRTQQFPLRALVTRPDVASSLASSLRSASSSLRVYRKQDAFDLDDAIDLLETWAESRVPRLDGEGSESLRPGD
jgi:dimethylamine monooxygenase subunit A